MLARFWLVKYLTAVETQALKLISQHPKVIELLIFMFRHKLVIKIVVAFQYVCCGSNFSLL